jgi:hypothetical protein
MRSHFFPLSLVIAVVGPACSSLEPYRVSATVTDIATIEDQAYKLLDSDFLEVMSIDRSRIDGQSRGINADWFPANGRILGDRDVLIPLRVGLRKLEVQACKYSPPLKYGHVLGGWHCGHAVLRLVVEPRTQYRLRGQVNKQDNYAELWIEYATSGQTAADVTRVDLIER